MAMLTSGRNREVPEMKGSKGWSEWVVLIGESSLVVAETTDTFSSLMTLMVCFVGAFDNILELIKCGK